jgi:hypothetical protein
MNDPLTSRSRLVAVAAIGASGLTALLALPSTGGTRYDSEMSPLPRWLWSMPPRSADPVEAIAAGARLVAIVVLAYLVLIAAANLLASFVPAERRRAPAWRVLHSLTPRWLAMASVGVVLGAGPVAAEQPGGAAVERPAPVMEVVGAATVTPTTSAAPRGQGSTTTVPDSTRPSAAPRTTSSDDDGAPGMPWADDPEPPAIDPASPLQPLPDPETAAGRTATAQRPVGSGSPSIDQLPPSAAVYRVQPGDHFWSIAEQVVIGRDGPTASDSAVAAYWRRLVDANRDRLVDPSNPDLILPGQVFDLPW